MGFAKKPSPHSKSDSESSTDSILEQVLNKPMKNDKETIEDAKNKVYESMVDADKQSIQGEIEAELMKTTVIKEVVPVGENKPMVEIDTIEKESTHDKDRDRTGEIEREYS
jgi:hypothetical protein